MARSTRNDGHGGLALDDLPAICGRLRGLLIADEYLICQPSKLVDEELHSQNISPLSEAALEMGILGESAALLNLQQKIQRLAKISGPVLFSGEPGVGKKTFALLLHRLSSNASSACVTFDCREFAIFGGSKGTLKKFLGPLPATRDSGCILLHPEVLSPETLSSVCALLLESNDCPRFYFSTDGRSLQRFLLSVDGNVRELLERKIVNVPNLDVRREDIRPCVLAKLADLNRRTGLQKRILLNALERICKTSYTENFRTLHGVLERMHATQASVLDCSESLIAAEGTQKTNFHPHLGEGFKLETFLHSIRESAILQALHLSNNHQAQAARILGITPQAVHKFLKIFHRQNGENFEVGRSFFSDEVAVEAARRKNFVKTEISLLNHKS